MRNSIYLALGVVLEIASGRKPIDLTSEDEITTNADSNVFEIENLIHLPEF